jgi:two-component system sensor histidine kinase EvgS
MPQAGPRILIVDDEQYNIWALAALLTRMGLAKPAYATTGAAAVALHAAEPFQLIILDRLLGDMDGADVARQLRSVETGRRARIVGLTGHATDEERADCCEAGMDLVLTKPLTPAKLRSLLAAPEDRPPDGINTNLLRFICDGDREKYHDAVKRYALVLAQERRHLLRFYGTGNRAALGRACHRMMGHARLIDAGRLVTELDRLQDAAFDRKAPLAQPVTRVRRAAEALEKLLLQRIEPSRQKPSRRA